MNLSNTENILFVNRSGFPSVNITRAVEKGRDTDCVLEPKEKNPKVPISRFCEKYNFFNKEELLRELKIFYNLEKIKETKNFEEVTETFYKREYFEDCPEVEKTLNFINSYSITSTTAERTFYLMENIFTSKRSTQFQERMNSICFLSFHKEMIKKEWKHI